MGRRAAPGLPDEPAGRLSPPGVAGAIRPAHRCQPRSPAVGDRPQHDRTDPGSALRGESAGTGQARGRCRIVAGRQFRRSFR